MNQYDNDLLELYNKYDIEYGKSDMAKNQQVYHDVMVLTKLEESKKGRPVFKLLSKPKALLISAALLMLVFLVGAGILSVYPLFKDILVLPVKSGSEDSSSMAKFIDSTGFVPGQTVSSSGLSIELKGIVGDEGSVKILLGLTREDGQPLAVKQSDGSYSSQNLNFKNASLCKKDFSDFAGFSSDIKMIDYDSTKNTATMLLDFTFSNPVSIGEKYILRLQDLRQAAETDGTRLNIEPNSLIKILAEFGNTTAKDYEHSGYCEDEKGQKINDFMLTVGSGKKIAFYKDFSITNADIRDGNLYLLGTGGTYEDFEDYLEKSSLVNPDTGDTIPMDAASYTEVDGESVWSLRFADITSEQQLENIEWYAGRGFEKNLLIRGDWAFEFDLDFTSHALKAQKINKTFSWNGYSFIAESLSVSPYSLLLSLKMDAELMKQCTPEPEQSDLLSERDTVAVAPSLDDFPWMNLSHQITITLKNGEIITANSCVISTHTSEDGTGTIDLMFPIIPVIDPADVASITAGELTVPFDN